MTARVLFAILVGVVLGACTGGSQGLKGDGHRSPAEVEADRPALVSYPVEVLKGYTP